MMDFRLVREDGSAFTVSADTRDVLVWEKTGKNASFQQLGESPSMTELYRLAHIAAKRCAEFTGSLDEFERTVVLDFSEESEEPRPTKKAR